MTEKPDPGEEVSALRAGVQQLAAAQQAVVETVPRRSLQVAAGAAAVGVAVLAFAAAQFGARIHALKRAALPTAGAVTVAIPKLPAVIAPPGALKTHPLSADDIYAAAKIAAANFMIARPDTSDAAAVAAATAVALQAGDPDAKITGEYAASDARDWIATRKSNGFPPLTTLAQLAVNDAAADAAEHAEARRACVEFGPAACSSDTSTLAPSRGAHYFPKIGTCFDTEVASIGSRLENIPDSGAEVEYTDGHSQVSYGPSSAVQAFRVGDPIRLCVTNLPGHCPPADDRGIRFVAINSRTGRRWEAGDGEHQCGGA
jgi:hypothetical protein